MECLNCNSKNKLSDLGFGDAGAYPSSIHKVSIKKGFTSRIMGNKDGTSLVRAYVCADCGFVALFTQNPEELSGS